MQVQTQVLMQGGKFTRNSNTNARERRLSHIRIRVQQSHRLESNATHEHFKKAYFQDGGRG